jgi:DNA-binding NarL/FixJ family response regulator
LESDLIDDEAGKRCLKIIIADDHAIVRRGLKHIVLAEHHDAHVCEAADSNAVLMLSMHPEERFAVRALKAGASGYLTKESAPDELCEAIRKVLRGGRYISPSLAELLADTLGSGIKIYMRAKCSQLANSRYCGSSLPARPWAKLLPNSL